MPDLRRCFEATLPALVNDYVRSGKVKLQARPLHFIGADSVARRASPPAAKQQGHLWPFLEAFYASQGQENSGYVTDGFLRSVASAAGIDGATALDYAASRPPTRRWSRPTPRPRG